MATLIKKFNKNVKGINLKVSLWVIVGFLLLVVVFSKLALLEKRTLELERFTTYYNTFLCLISLFLMS